MVDYSNVPDGALVYTARTGWIGEVRGDWLWYLTNERRGTYKGEPAPIGLTTNILEVWSSREWDMDIIIAPPGTPEWDEINARMVRAML